MIGWVFFDIDGVLTDGKVAIDCNGKEIKHLCFGDIDAIFELKRKGIKVGFITGEQNTFTEYIKQRFSPNYHLDGCKNKLEAFKKLERDEGIIPEKTAFVGDSRKDTELLGYIGYSFAPSDAETCTRQTAKHILGAKRGNGVVREMVDFLLNEKVSCKTNFTAQPISSIWKKRMQEHGAVVECIHNDEALLLKVEEVAALVVNAFRAGNKLLICGNGGSAADAQHIATELVSKFYKERKALNAEAITVNTSTITAIGNDYEYDKVFARQVEAKGKGGDILLAISTSGNAKNVLEAVNVAKVMGMKTIALTGANKNCLMANKVDYCLNVPSEDTPRIQEAHILIGHVLCEYIEMNLF